MDRLPQDPTTFREMVEDAQKHNMLAIVRDEKPGQYTIRLPAGDE